MKYDVKRDSMGELCQAKAQNHVYYRNFPMLHSNDLIPTDERRSIPLRLNAQQRELLQRTVDAEGLTSIAELVRMAIAQTRTGDIR
jgi:hypothetical protein